MKFCLQFGYGMMEHCRHLISAWGEGTVILSPRDMSDKQIHTLSLEISNIKGGRVMIDPQFYLPHADHARLCTHDYWPSSYNTGLFFQGSQLQSLLNKLNTLNKTANTSAFILPGFLATQVDDIWLGTQSNFIDAGRQIAGTRPIIATIALSANVVQDQNQIELLIETAQDWKPDGFYIVCEHPQGDYLVQDPNWLVNVLDLVAGLRLLGAKVILGYCNHQMLIASVAKVDAICSGTWMNVRSFPPDKFRQKYDEEIQRRATWYYCPQALSEYKIPFLDVAWRQNLLSEMKPPTELDGGYASKLFTGIQPSTVSFLEQSAFRHYLHALHEQAQSLVHDTYDEAVDAQNELLDKAEDILSTLITAGIRGQNRDFRDLIDVNRSALSLFNTLRGAMLRRKWSSLW